MEFNLLKLDDVFLTQDGLSTGSRAWSAVTGLPIFYVGSAGKHERNADGSLINFVNDIVDGEVNFNFDWIEIDKLDEVNGVLTIYIGNGLSFPIEITGEMGTFTGTAKFIFPDPVRFGETYFSNIVNDVSIRLAVTLGE